MANLQEVLHGDTTLTARIATARSGLREAVGIVEQPVRNIARTADGAVQLAGSVPLELSGLILAGVWAGTSRHNFRETFRGVQNWFNTDPQIRRAAGVVTAMVTYGMLNVLKVL